MMRGNSPSTHRMLNRLTLGLMLVVACVLLAACGPTASGPFNEYYVSLDGSDTSGDGSEGNPWRTIMHAVNNADYRGDPVTIHIGPGEYVENIYLLRPVILRGAGSGNPFSGEVTYIRWAVPPEGRGPAHRIVNTRAELYDMTFDVGRVQAVLGSVRVENVWFWNAWGYYGLQLIDVGAFSVVNSEFHTGFNIFADYALDIRNSTGEVLGGYFGDWYDHPINLTLYPGRSPMIVNIDGVTIRGSVVCFADGIRISGGPIVTVANSDIRREHADAEPACTSLEEVVSDGASAGIGVQRVPHTGGVNTVTLVNNVTAGFDAGLAFDVRRTHVKIEGNTVSGLTYDVLTWRHPNASHSVGASLDFGGGPQGSIGGNTFQDGNPWAFYINEDYDVMACNNDWVVPDDQVDPERIFDELDDPSKGRVFWMCASEGIQAGPTEPLVEIFTDTPTPTLTPLTDISVVLTGNARCRRGPGTVYDDHDFFSAGDQSVASGRNTDASWLLIAALNNGGTCWISRSVVQTDASDVVLLSLPEIAAPPTPTPTPLPTLTPTPSGSAPAAPQQASHDGQVCNAQEYTVTFSWTDAANNEQGYIILRNGTEIANLPANSTKYTDSPPYGGPYTYTIRAYNQFDTAQTTVQDAGCIY